MKVKMLDVKQIRLTDEDIQSIVEIEFHPNVQKWLYGCNSPDIQKEFREYREFFKTLSENKTVDILIAKYEGIIIGFLGLWKLGESTEKGASIGLSVHPDYWQRGIGTHLVTSAIKLAREKGFKKLKIETLAKNAAMKHIAERLGFKLESLKKDRIQKHKSYHDEAVYSLML